MSMKPQRTFQLGCGAAVIASMMLGSGVAAAAELAACVDESSPIASVSRKLVEAVAQQQGLTARIHEYDSSDNDEVNGLWPFRVMLDKDCDLIVDYPFDTDAPENSLAPLHATAPYARSSFMLVTPKSSAIKSLDDLHTGQKVGIGYMSPPNLYFLSHPEDFKPVILEYDSDSVKELVAGKLDAAIAWRASAVLTLEEAGKSADYVMTPVDHEHFTYQYMALYKADKQGVADSFEAGVAKLQSSGELQKIYGSYADVLAAEGASSQDSGAAQAPSAAAGTDDFPPALYTQAQADEGILLYVTNCARCHGGEMEGMSGPGLTGPKFASVKADFNVHHIFEIVAKNMPATRPGSLQDEEYVKIMAYILEKNGYPAGDQELTYESAMNSEVKLIYQGG